MKKIFLKLWQNEFYKGGIFFTISSLTINFLNYLFNLLAGRILGPSGYGEIITLNSYVAIFSVPVSVLTTLIIQKIGSKDKNRFIFAKQLEKWIISKVKRWWPLIIIPLTAIPFLDQITNLSPITVATLVPIVILTYASTFYVASLQGLRLFLIGSVIGVTSVIIKLLGPVIGLTLDNDLFIVLLFLFLSNAFIFAGSLKVFKQSVVKIKKPTFTLDNRLLVHLLNPKLIISTASLVAVILLNNLDIIYAKKYLSAQEAGIYGAWSLLAKVIFYFAGPIVSICFVYFSSKKNEGSQKKVFLISLVIISFIGAGSYLLYTLFPKFVITIFFGSQFLSLIPYLSLASVFGTMYALSFFINNYFIAKESKYALILPVAVTIYAVLLFYIDNQLISLMKLSMYFTTILALIYVIVSLWDLVYNKRQ